MENLFSKINEHYIKDYGVDVYGTQNQKITKILKPDYFSLFKERSMGGLQERQE